MSEPENYAFTRAKIRAERSASIKANVTTIACILIPAAVGSLIHEGTAVALGVIGFCVDALYIRRSK
jgi:hypothetical protein